MWQRIEGAEMICATDTCSYEPSWRLDAGGIESVYCTRCKTKIEAATMTQEQFDKELASVRQTWKDVGA